ncbi:MAG: beta-lactamase hydrolase domain-containing protein [Lysobacter sp.]
MNQRLNPSCAARVAASLALALLVSSCSAAQPPGAEPSVVATPEVGADGAVQALQTAIPGLRAPRAGLYTAAQPQPEAWSTVAERGITTVVNLRPDGEMAGRDEAAEVAAAGMVYHHLPVAGAGDINDANAEQLQRLIEQAPGAVLVHCASGNRVGALLAVGAAKSGEMTAEEAITFGREAGLGSLEPRVREVLESTPDDE